MTPAPDFTIRPMCKADRQSVIDLLWALNLFENALTRDRAIERRDAEQCLVADETAAKEKPGGALLVAETGGMVVGFLALSMEPGAPFVRVDQRGHGHVLDLIVAEAYRNRGVGRALLNEAERLTREAGYSNLLIGVAEGNEGALNAYEKFGFRPNARELVKPLY